MRQILRFECHYHGAPVVIGKEYDKADLHADVLYDDGELKSLSPYEYNVPDDRLITDKDNIFIASYVGLSDVFHVKGVTLNESDAEFKVFSIEGKTEVDVTYAYEPLLYNTVLEKIYVNLDRLNRVFTAGKYRMILPRNTGMCSKYASEWIVIKGKNNSIKATPVKFYTEEI